MNWSESRRDPGQATVEFALLAPVALLLCAVLIVVACTASDQVALVRASGTVAREASLYHDDPARLRSLLLEVVHLRPIDLEVTVGDELVTVVVRHESIVSVFGVRSTLRTLTASATMPLEQGG